MGDHHHMGQNMKVHINYSNMNNGMNQMANEHPHEHTMTDSILNAATDMNMVPGLRSHKHSMQDSKHTGHSMSMMTFHGGCMETILFSWWKTDDVGAFIGSFIAIFLMALLYEGLKYYRKHLLWKTYTGLQYCAVAPPDKNVTNICATDEPQQVIQPVPHVLERNVPTMLSAAHGFQTGLHGIQVLVSYMLMLVFMTYNTWLCAAVVLGSATGYFLFGWRESVVVDFTEHCH